MTTNRARIASVCAVLGTAVIGAATLAPTALAAPKAPLVKIEPANLTRGPDQSVPHLEGRFFVNGDVRVRLGAVPVYLGASGEDHVVGSTNQRGSLKSAKVVRISPTGEVTELVRKVQPYGAVLSRDGSRIFSAIAQPGRGKGTHSRYRVFDAATGEKLSDTRIPGYPEVLDATRNRAYVSAWDRGTYTLNVQGKRRSTISKQHAGVLDLGLGLAQFYTGDPYRKGCARVARVDAPRRTIWKSCDERVEAFNTDGTAMATVGILSDGIGPGEVWTRTLDGTLTARYSTYWFGRIQYESPTALLLEANGKKSAATVRCTGTVCENTTDPTKPQQPRLTIG